MSKAPLEDEQDMAPEYDFSQAIRNPYAALAKGGVRVALDEDVQDAFPDQEAVNAALRLLMKAGRSAVKLRKAS